MTRRGANGTKLRIAIVQPCVPHYRVPFFCELARLLEREARLCVIYSKTDENGVRTPENLHVMVGSCMDLVSVRRRSFMGKVLFWQQLPWRILRDSDVVIVNWNLRYLSSVCLAILCAVRGQRVIGWGHYESRSGNRASQYLRQRLMGLFDVFWCYTELEARQAACELPNLKDIVVGLNNGLEVDPANLAQVQAASRRKSYVRVCRFLFIGRITPKTKFPLLLEALQLLDRTEGRPTICIEVIGDVPDSIREQTAHMQCSNRVHFHGAVFDSEAIDRIASDCHYFVYPGSVGLSLLHAFSLGLPALIHSENAEHMPEVAAAVDGQNMLQFGKADARSLADTMCRAMLMPADDYLKMVNACIETVRNDFNVGRMAERAATTLLA